MNPSEGLPQTRLPEPAHRILRRLISFGAGVADALLPPVCLVCSSPALSIDDESRYTFEAGFCEDCRSELSRPAEHTCSRCGAACGPFARTDDGCPHCRRRTLSFETLVCLNMYEGALRQAVLNGKRAWSSAAVTATARLFASCCKAQLEQLRCDVIIPVPQHWTHRLTRRFNAAELVAEEIAGSLKLPCDRHVLVRHRRVRPQKRVRLAERTENQRGSFRIDYPETVRGRRILLVDDVATTGATCSEAARCLKQAGASACCVAVLARVADQK